MGVHHVQFEAGHLGGDGVKENDLACLLLAFLLAAEDAAEVIILFAFAQHQFRIRPRHAFESATGDEGEAVNAVQGDGRFQHMRRSQTHNEAPIGGDVNLLYL